MTASPKTPDEKLAEELQAIVSEQTLSITSMAHQQFKYDHLVTEKTINDIENKAVAAILTVIKEDRKSTSKKTAANIFALAHEYAQNDQTMVGSEPLRAYHYYNAISKIGEFDDR